MAYTLKAFFVFVAVFLHDNNNAVIVSVTSERCDALRLASRFAYSVNSATNTPIYTLFEAMSQSLRAFSRSSKAGRETSVGFSIYVISLTIRGRES